jgi:hypothetical protein
MVGGIQLEWCRKQSFRQSCRNCHCAAQPFSIISVGKRLRSARSRHCWHCTTSRFPFGKFGNPLGASEEEIHGPRHKAGDVEAGKECIAESHIDLFVNFVHRKWQEKSDATT